MYGEGELERLRTQPTGKEPPVLMRSEQRVQTAPSMHALVPPSDHPFVHPRIRTTQGAATLTATSSKTPLPRRGRRGPPPGPRHLHSGCT